MDNFQRTVALIKSEFDAAVKSSKGEAFMRFSSVLTGVDQELREFVQESTMKDIKRIITKLKSTEPLTSDELALVKLWVVGDAEHYARLENNYDDWTAELNRLVKQIDALEKDEWNVENCMQMRGLIYDATRVLGDMIYFLQQKDRLERFKDSTEEIDEEERGFLLEILEQKIKSNQF